jgi:hypothetical protein
MHHLTRRMIANHCQKFLLQYSHWLEASVRPKILRKRTITRARYVTGCPIERFDFAEITRCRSRVEQQIMPQVSGSGVIQQHLASVVMQGHLRRLAR